MDIIEFAGGISPEQLGVEMRDHQQLWSYEKFMSGMGPVFAQRDRYGQTQENDTEVEPWDAKE